MDTIDLVIVYIYIIDLDIHTNDLEIHTDNLIILYIITNDIDIVYTRTVCQI